MDSSVGDKMRFCKRQIRDNRQEVDCGRNDETTKLRQFAEEWEIANNCLKLSVCLSGDTDVLYRKKVELSHHHSKCPRDDWIEYIIAQRETMTQVYVAIRSVTWARPFCHNLTWLNVTFLLSTATACDQG